MLHTHRGINFQDVYKQSLYDLMRDGHTTSPRGMETKEFIPMVLQIQNPLSRMLTLKSRKANPFYGMIETLWYMNGDNSVEPLAFYNRAMKNFSDDGETLRGAYGARLIKRSDELDKSQFGLVYDKLRKDPSSRQAVMVIFDPWRDFEETKDVPCTVTFAFTIREEKLNMTVLMRSNDIVWGATYDVFAFTMFQEFLARKLGVGLGNYTHIANSFHIYDRHYDMAWNMIKDETPVMHMPPMPDTRWTAFNELYEFEHQVRLELTGLEDALRETDAYGDYWGQWAKMIVLHKAIKSKDAAIAHKTWGRLIKIYQEVTLPWVERTI